MPSPSTKNGWPFPPTTREVQLDEKWAFVSQEEKSCDPLDPLDRLRGDDWGHTAVHPERRLLLAPVPGNRDGDACKNLVQQVHNRTAGRTDLLITSDEHAPYETAIKEVYSVERPRPKRPGPGRPPKPERILPADLCYATVRKTRAKGRVVEVVRTLVFGTMLLLGAYLWRSRASTTVNTSFVERHNGTDRHQNSRKPRKTYGFSKGIEVHHAASYRPRHRWSPVTRTGASTPHAPASGCRTGPASPWPAGHDPNLSSRHRGRRSGFFPPRA